MIRCFYVLTSLALLVGTTTMGFAPGAVHKPPSTRSRRRQHLKPLTLAGKNENDDEMWVSDSDSDDSESIGRRNLLINTVAAGLIAASGVASYSLFQTNVYTPSEFTRLPRTQFIAALGDPSASEGTIDTANDGAWGIWALDPGPRGVWLKDYSPSLETAPAGWKFDKNNWWLEEHGLIMEKPYFPLPPGRYLVTGGRLVTTGLTITKDGRWKLDEGTLYDVTHLPCRSARYQPIATDDASVKGAGTPLAANPRNFPVTPGAEMPPVPGTTKRDYAVLFVVGKAAST